MRPPKIALLLSLPFAATACSSGEQIRVRETGRAMFAGRVRMTKNMTRPERRRVAIGAELGAYGTSGDYASPSGSKDYRATVGYAAFVTDISLGKFTIMPKLGVGAVDFAVAGQTTTIGDDGLGLLLGIEGRYRFADSFDVFARATTFQRSSLDSSMLEAGIGFYPDPHVGLELGYGSIAVGVDDASDIFSVEDEADVEVEGILFSVTLQF